MRNLSTRWLDSAPAHLARLVTVTVSGSAARGPWGCLLVPHRDLAAEPLWLSTGTVTGTAERLPELPTCLKSVPVSSPEPSRHRELRSPTAPCLAHAHTPLLFPEPSLPPFSQCYSSPLPDGRTEAWVGSETCPAPCWWTFSPALFTTLRIYIENEPRFRLLPLRGTSAAQHHLSKNSEDPSPRHSSPSLTHSIIYRFSHLCLPRSRR